MSCVGKQQEGHGEINGANFSMLNAHTDALCSGRVLGSLPRIRRCFFR